MSTVLRVVLAVSLLAVALSVSADFQPFRPLPDRPPIPEDNAMSPAKVTLGQQLFFDPRLSVNGALSCNSCHNTMGAGDDGRALSVGATGVKNRRNAPSLWNVGFYTIYFWDGAATSLEAAIQAHIVTEQTMAMPSAVEIIKRLNAAPDYVAQFTQVFGADEPISYAHIAKALAAYLRTLVTSDSPFDQYLRGNKTALSEQAHQGFQQFIETGCASCHFWVNLAGPVPGLAFEMGEGFYELFPNYLGSEYDQKYNLLADVGRIQVTGIKTDDRMWRVASLRNVAVTAPYFHNGAVATLEEAIRVMAKVQLKLELTEVQVANIAAFLNSLTGEFPRQSLPRLPAIPNRALYSAQP